MALGPRGDSNSNPLFACECKINPERVCAGSRIPGWWSACSPEPSRAGPSRAEMGAFQSVPDQQRYRALSERTGCKYCRVSLKQTAHTSVRSRLQSPAEPVLHSLQVQARIRTENASVCVYVCLISTQIMHPRSERLFFCDNFILLKYGRWNSTHGSVLLLVLVSNAAFSPYLDNIWLTNPRRPRPRCCSTHCGRKEVLEQLLEFCSFV